MIEVSNISKTFGEVKALDQVSFQVERGQIVGFLGSNGAGKTTTMDIVCGCLGSDDGFVKVGGVDMFKDPIAAKRKIGYLPDEPPIHTDMKVIEFVRYVAELRGVKKKEMAAAVDRVMSQLSLEPMAERLVGNLSKGYRQRVGLAQALIHNPEILILDEPTEGLDPNQIKQIRELILSLKGEHTILFSSHILSEVQSLCDRLIIIDKGRIIEQGTYQTIMGRFKGSNVFHLRVRQGASALRSKLSQVTGLTLSESTDALEHDLSFTLDDEAEVDTVARLALDGGHGLVALTPQTASLEEIFHKLTQ